MKQRIATIYIDETGCVHVSNALKDVVVKASVDGLDLTALSFARKRSWKAKCFAATLSLTAKTKAFEQRKQIEKRTGYWQTRCANVAISLRKRVSDSKFQRKKGDRKPLIASDWKTKIAHSMKRICYAKRNFRARSLSSPWVIKCASVRHNMRVRSKQMPKNSASQKELFELLERQQYRCSLTGAALQCSQDADNAVCDHIVPVCRDGASTIENLQWITKEANKAKGTMTNQEFVELCRKVVELADKKAEAGRRMRQAPKVLSGTFDR